MASSSLIFSGLCAAFIYIFPGLLAFLHSSSEATETTEYSETVYQSSLQTVMSSPLFFIYLSLSSFLINASVCFDIFTKQQTLKVPKELSFCGIVYCRVGIYVGYLATSLLELFCWSDICCKSGNSKYFSNYKLLMCFRLLVLNAFKNKMNPKLWDGEGVMVLNE